MVRRITEIIGLKKNNFAVSLKNGSFVTKINHYIEKGINHKLLLASERRSRSAALA
jgi:hypothetical protein